MWEQMGWGLWQEGPGVGEDDGLRPALCPPQPRGPQFLSSARIHGLGPSLSIKENTRALDLEDLVFNWLHGLGQSLTF